MRERVLLRHIGLQALEALDDESMEKQDYIDWLNEAIADIAVELSGGSIDTYDEVRGIIEGMRYE